MGAMPSVLSPTELLRLRSDPAAGESHSPLFGASLLCIDLAVEPPAVVQPDPGWAWLAELPVVLVGMARSGIAPRGLALASALDVVAESDDDLAEIRATCERAPLAALVLAQLLRGSLARSSPDGLLAESLAYSTLQAGPEFAAWCKGRSAKHREPETEPALRVTRVAGELSLQLNRPGKRNAYSAELRDALCEALALVIQDPSIVRVTLSGAGPSFCSGGDLDEFGSLPDPASAHAIRTTRSAAALLARVATRVEARVHGACVGAGVELPAFCRRVIASPDSFFLLPELGMGLVPGAGGTVSLPRRIGRQRTAWLALTRRRIGAEEALALGLVDEIRAT